MDQARENAKTQGALTAGQLWLTALAVLAIWVAFSKLTIRVHSDDAMRLVQVRDLLAGQGWFDLTQYRLGLEGGTAMHWSRLVDAPIAGLILLAGLFTPTAQAEAIAMVVWPGLSFGGTVFALGAIAYRLGGVRAALYGAIIAAILLGQSGKFDPGSLDHHNVQIFLLVTALAGFVWRRVAQNYAAIAGVAVALALGVGVETLPQIALVCASFPIAWIWFGPKERRAALGFSAALSVGLTLVFIGTGSTAAWAGGFCDALSRDIFLPTIIGGVGLTLVAALYSDKSVINRAGAALGIGVVVGAVVMLVAPACLSNPLDSLDPILHEKWLSRVAETKSLADFSVDRLGAFAAGVVGLLIAQWFAMRGENSDAWLALSASLAVALAFTAYQSRGFPVMVALSVLPTAVLAAKLSDLPSEGGSVIARLGMVGAVLLSIPAFTSVLAQHGAGLVKQSQAAAPARVGRAASARVTPASSSDIPCTAEGDMDALAALPPGTVSAPSYLGTHVLLYTHHRALAAPYHRNQAGLLAQLDLAYAPAETTQTLLNKYAVDYVITCEGDRQFVRENPGLSTHLVKGKESGFLTRVGAETGPLSIYRVEGRQP